MMQQTKITLESKSRKEQLYTMLASNEVLQNIYSDRDPVRLEELKSQAKPLELELLDILTEENKEWLTRGQGDVTGNNDISDDDIEEMAQFFADKQDEEFAGFNTEDDVKEN